MMNTDEAIKILDPEMSRDTLMEMMGGTWNQTQAMKLLQEAQSMGLQALRAQQTGGWINVKDRLPPPRLKVLVWFSGNRHFDPQSIISFRIPNSEEIMYENEFGKATHWQPLPEPPKKAYMK